MATDPRLAYLDARAAYDSALSVVRKHGQMAETVGRSLNSGHVEEFTNVALYKKRSAFIDPLDLDQWPDGVALKTALVGLHNAFLACRGAWDGVPEDAHAGLVRPPSKPGDP